MSKRRPIRNFLLVGQVLLAIAAAPAAGASFSDIVIFGDSLSDVHNTYTATWGFAPECPPYCDGRFSNGPVWVETLGDWLGLDASTASTDGGSNYAYGGAKTGSGYTSFLIPNVGTQVSRYLNAGGPSGGELLVLWAGANDFFDGERNASVVLANLSNHITSLASAGGENFLVANLPPLGQTPDNWGDPALNQVTQEFNAGLTALLDSLTASMGVTIYRLDTAGFFTTAVMNPAAYGLTNVTHPAYNETTGQIVPDPEHYLFWDGVHPTAAAHRLLGWAAAALVDPMDGDATRDGSVDVSDLSILAGSYRQSGKSWDEGDFSGDGWVDVSDLSLLAGHYRLTMGSAAPPGGLAPEPVSIALLATGGLWEVHRRRERTVPAA